MFGVCLCCVCDCVRCVGVFCGWGVCDLFVVCVCDLCGLCVCVRFVYVMCVWCALCVFL